MPHAPRIRAGDHVYSETVCGYDGNGARVSADEDGALTTYAWAPQERLSEIREGGRAIQKNSYDPYARRTVLEEQGGKKVFLYDGSSVTNRYLVEAPTKGQGSGTRNIWLGGSLVAVVSDGQAWCLMADALGSVVAVTNTAGVAVRRNHYKPFGEESSQGAQVPAMATAAFVGGLGVQSDVATGMSYMWHRYYVPDTGGFLSRDPLGGFWIEGDLPVSLGILKPVQPYVYAANSPASLRDPIGLLEPLTTLVVAAVVIETLAAIDYCAKLLGNIAEQEVGATAIYPLPPPVPYTLGLEVTIGEDGVPRTQLVYLPQGVQTPPSPRPDPI